jgi:hypothetical protein
VLVATTLPHTTPLGHAHAPDEQVLPNRHRFPHVPQLLLSDAVFTHAPLQLVNPVLHPHAPHAHWAEHDCDMLVPQLWLVFGVQTP